MPLAGNGLDVLFIRDDQQYIFVFFWCWWPIWYQWHMITFTVVSTQFSETFSEANLIQSGQMCLITKHDHPPV